MPASSRYLLSAAALSPKPPWHALITTLVILVCFLYDVILCGGPLRLELVSFDVGIVVTGVEKHLAKHRIEFAFDSDCEIN
jgi:hypothetical protein